MSEWKEYKLAEIINDVAMGPFGSNLKVDNFISSGVPVIRGGNLNNGGFEDKNFVYVSEEKAKSLKRSLAYPDDLVFTHRGTIGQVGIIEKTKYPYYLVSQSQMRLTVNKQFLSPRYLYYWFKSKTGQYELLKNSAQVGVPAIASPTKSLKEIDIKIPDLPTQTAIAEILSSLDDKIELNYKINQELETLAQTLFKQWFIDFEFPNENGEPYKSFGGEMVDSELGEIPKGWKVKTLDDISNITIGRTPPRKEHQWFSTDINDVKWISIRDMGNCGTYIHTTSEFLTEDAVSRFNVPIINSNTVIISFKLTVGRISITTERMLSNEAIAHLNIKNKEIYPEFLYLFLKQFNFDSLGSTSSIATAVNSKSIKSLPFINPSKEVLSKFNEVIVPLFSRIHNLTFENKEIVNLRDTLLPKLISGELELKEISN